MVFFFTNPAFFFENIMSFYFLLKSCIKNALMLALYLIFFPDWSSLISMYLSFLQYLQLFVYNADFLCCESLFDNIILFWKRTLFLHYIYGFHIWYWVVIQTSLKFVAWKMNEQLFIKKALFLAVILGLKYLVFNFAMIFLMAFTFFTRNAFISSRQLRMCIKRKALFFLYLTLTSFTGFL